LLKRIKRAISTTIVAVIVVIIIIAIIGGVYLAVMSRTPGNPSSPSSNQTSVPSYILIGASIPLSGNFAFFGPEQNFTFNLAVQEINAAGGVCIKSLGKCIPLKIAILDDGSQSQNTLNNMQTFINEGAVAIAGQLGGNTGLFTPFAEQHHIIYVGANYPITSSNQNYSWVYTIFHNQNDEANVFFHWLANQTTPSDTTVAIVEEQGDDASAANGAAGYQVATQLGFKVVFQDTYPTGATVSQLETEMLKLKQNHIDVVYGLPIPPDAINMIQAAHDVNYVPKAWGLTRGTAVYPFGQVLGNLSNYVTASFDWSPYVKYTWQFNNATFTTDELVKNLTSAGIHPILAGMYWAEVQLIAQAIENANSLQESAIQQAMNNINISTPIGRVAFLPTHWDAYTGQNMLLFQWMNGTLQIIYPNSQKTANGVFPVPGWNS
jgi:branched-chain amino acid transport system substrate-binding protein